MRHNKGCDAGVMKRLKADLHTHACDDPYDVLPYSAEMLIDAVAEAGVDVLAVTCHGTNVYGTRMAEYALRRHILLVPGSELFIEGRHVVALNPSREHMAAKTFDELRRAGRQNAAFFAPHPYYPSPRSLGGKLSRNADCFDAVEYASLYATGLNLNRLAVRTARKHRLPMIGTTDTHSLPYYCETYSWLEAEPTVDGVIDAIRQGRIEVSTKPRSWSRTIHAGAHALGGLAKDLVGLYE
ncbi:MAG: hypothetical protein AMXMBFR84_22840 [Candidatus Hydrogenedentota bacterium]